MKAFAKFALILVFGLTVLSLPARIEPPVKSGDLEITVCPQGPPACDFAKIQEAIDAASEGATIRIGAGTYVENLVIRKSVRLVGLGQKKVFLKRPSATSPEIPTLWISAVEHPIQVWIEEVSSGEPVPPHLDGAIRIGIYIEGWAQVVLRRLTISGYALGVWIAVAERKGEFPLALLKPQVIIHEAFISHNFFGISTTTLAHTVHIRRTTIAENEVGVSSGDFLLKDSTVRKNRTGISVSLPLPVPGWWEQSAVEIENNLISENGVGIRLFAGRALGPPPEPKPGDVKPLAVISYNRVVGNQEYGVVIQTARCLVLEQNEVESAPIQVEGRENEMQANGKGDLCPEDYPWPPGFRK